MKKIALMLFLVSLISLPTKAAPPGYYTALTNGLPFIDLVASTGADLVSISNIEIFSPVAYGFEVAVIYPDGLDDTWYFVTELIPTGQIIVSPDVGPDFEDYRNRN